jgi:hypothetical protein
MYARGRRVAGLRERGTSEDAFWVFSAHGKHAELVRGGARRRSG